MNRAQNTRKKHIAERMRYPYFLQDAEFVDGRVVCREALMPDRQIDAEEGTVSEKTLAILFETSELYFVVGNRDGDEATIIFRKNLTDHSSEPERALGKGRDRPRPISENIPPLPDDELIRKATSLKHICVHLPEPASSILIHHQQILFRTSQRIFAWSPLSCSIIPVAAMDMSVDRFLYLLTEKSIVVYGEGRQKDIPLDGSYSRILAVNGSLWLVGRTAIHEMVDGEIVRTVELFHLIISACTDGRRIFALLQLNRVHAVDLETGEISTTAVPAHSGYISLSGGFLVVSNRRNAAMYLNVGDLSLAYTRMHSSRSLSFACDSCSSHFLEKVRIITYPDSPAPPVAPAIAGSGKEAAKLYEEIASAAGEEPGDDLAEELQTLLDDQSEQTDGEQVEIPSAQPRRAKRDMGEFIQQLNEVLESESSSMEMYFEDPREEDERLEDERILGRPVQRTPRRPISPAPSPYWCDPPALSPVSIRSLFATVSRDSAGRVITRYRKREHTMYRKSLFFVENHIEWFRDHFSIPSVAEKAVDSPVLEFIEQKIKEISDRRRPRAEEDAPRSTAPPLKKRRGGF